MNKEAEFAFKQAFAYCPFSPEAVFHFMDLLLSQPTPRIDDAILLLETCHKLDPYNGQITDWIDQLKRSKTGARGTRLPDSYLLLICVCAIWPRANRPSPA